MWVTGYRLLVENQIDGNLKILLMLGKFEREFLAKVREIWEGFFSSVCITSSES